MSQPKTKDKKYKGVKTGTVMTIPPPIPVAQTPQLGLSRADSGNDGMSLGTRIEHDHYKPSLVSTRSQFLNPQGYIPDSVTTLDRKFATGIWARVLCLSTQKQILYDKGWEYYERITLPRYKVGESKMKLAEKGETEVRTRIYPLFNCSIAMFSDFGISVSLYFSTLLILSVILAVAAAMNVPNILFFAGESWSGSQQTLRASSTLGNIALIGSAYCDQNAYVTCPTCDPSNFKSNRYIEANTGIFYYKINTCGITIDPVLVDFATILFLFLSIIFMGVYQKKLAVKFDEKAQTASDYSLTVHDPCPDAHTCDEWCDFFTRYGEVAAVCVTLDNQNLVNLLVEQRRLRSEISLNLLNENGGSQSYDEEIGFLNEDETGCFEGVMNGVGLMKGLPLLHEELVTVQGKLKEEVDRFKKMGGYATTKVYVTFENEEGQRKALNALSTGLIAAWTDTSKNIPVTQRFRGKNVLKIEESKEPSATRWSEIHISTVQKYKERFISWTLTLGIIIGGGFSVYGIHKSGEIAIAAGFISIFNSVIPILCSIFNSLESHASEGGAQESLYMKIAFARWTNTAIVICVITPFTSMINTTELLLQVYTVLFADVITYPLFRILDFGGTFNKFFLAPYAKNQAVINTYFQGTAWSVAERYTDITKTMFLCFFYAAIYPASYIFCLAALLLNFVVDRYCIVRLWKLHPQTGAGVASVSFKFMLISILAHSVLSSYWWSGFPFDNLCVDESDGTNNASVQITTPDGATTFTQAGSSYAYCNQDLLTRWKFPALPEFQGEHQWMTSNQALMVSICGIASAVFLGFIFFGFFGTGIFFSVKHLFVPAYKESGRDQNIPFSCCRGEISSHIPQYNCPGFDHPFIATSLEHIDTDLQLKWNCHGNETFADWCLCSDVDLGDLIRKEHRSRLFASTKYYPPGGSNVYTSGEVDKITDSDGSA
ncbi:hypothetical protein TrST_g13678 [Triparma strigata]|uniref:CSC1/OSCA1-like cytosolic domain-containing protein n=1 Tax=Triparma strigata TaxID=1606541 RepID=A0A9W7BUA7_9STRA|nr:hypothetical protein TrST_g13678 [Triparma strigata]